jgi:predicted ribosomally synthesized peptide with SipW-like signal peptide
MKTAMGMFAALMVALAVTGVAFAWWNKTLTIQGTISTGELDVEFKDIASNDSGTSPDPIKVGENRVTSDYHVATCEAEGSDVSEPDPTLGDLDKITVTITNAYPCYYPQVTFQVKNGGTIPAKVASINYTGTSPQVSVVLGGISVGEVIAAGASVNCRLDIHVTDAAMENSSYTITVTIDFVQFNAT